MKDHETFKPLEVVGAKGSYLHLKDGRLIIDAISSWWCKTLGHQHPRLKQALKAQLDKFEHVILANTTNDTIVHLSEKLTRLSPTLNKVFYASEGSSAVEIALKMSLHARQLEGNSRRRHFLTLENSYHGETLGALSVSDMGLYRAPYADLLFPVTILSGVPYVHHQKDALWNDASVAWENIERQLAPFSETATAIIIEPIVQGAGGMQIYSQDFLRRLRQWTKQHGVHLIADEIMTGMARTGKMLACEHASIEPDFICLSKGLTSGWLPLSAVLIPQSIYDLFYADYGLGKSFLHSHTFSGNALAASVAVEVLSIIEEEGFCERACALGEQMYGMMQEIAQTTGRLINVRGIGGIVAADLTPAIPHRRLGFEVYQQAVQRGALLRPLGNTIYWLPPLTISAHELESLQEITAAAIAAVAW